jgi:hypothetical protein
VTAVATVRTAGANIFFPVERNSAIAAATAADGNSHFIYKHENTSSVIDNGQLTIDNYVSILNFLFSFGAKWQLLFVQRTKDYAKRQGLGIADILCVFQNSQTEVLWHKIRYSVKNQLTIGDIKIGCCISLQQPFTSYTVIRDYCSTAYTEH